MSNGCEKLEGDLMKDTFIEMRVLPMLVMQGCATREKNVIGCYQYHRLPRLLIRVFKRDSLFEAYREVL